MIFSVNIEIILVGEGINVKTRFTLYDSVLQKFESDFIDDGLNILRVNFCTIGFSYMNFRWDQIENFLHNVGMLNARLRSDVILLHFQSPCHQFFKFEY